MIIIQCIDDLGVDDVGIANIMVDIDAFANTTISDAGIQWYFLDSVKWRIHPHLVLKSRYLSNDP